MSASWETVGVIGSEGYECAIACRRSVKVTNEGRLSGTERREWVSSTICKVS